RAGGAYVPLDPLYPEERLHFLLGDSGAPVWVTEGRLLAALPASLLGERAVPVLVDGCEAAAEPESISPEEVPHPEALAYVIYTSGSTGSPKGVMVPHRGLTSLLAAQAERLRPAPGRRVLQFFSPSFDGSVWEI